MFILNFNKFAETVSLNFTKEERTKMLLKIENVKQKQLSTDEQYKFIFDQLKLSDKKTFMPLESLIMKGFQNIQKKYGPNIDSQIFTNATAKVQEKLPKNNARMDDGCGFRFGLCAGSVGFQGGLLLAACEAVTAGVATPLCLAGTVIYAADGVAECRDKYCD